MKEYSLKEIYELSKTNEVQDLVWDISCKLMTVTINGSEALKVATVATMILGLKEGEQGLEKVRSFLEFVFPSPYSHQVWGIFSEEKYLSIDEKILLAVIVSADTEINVSKFNDSTPSCISDLVLKLMDIKKGNKVADLCCATGSFLTKAKVLHNDAKYYGYDVNTYHTLALQLKATFFDNFVEAKDIDMFDLQDERFDRIFMNHPFGWRLANNDKAAKFVEPYFQVTKSCFSDWAFVFKALSLLKENGKLITLVSNGCLYSGLDKEFRKKIVNENYLEAVIALPTNLFSNTFISTTLLVLSKKNNKKIKIVDASNNFVKTRRKNTMSEEDVKSIYNAVLKDCEISKTITKDEIVKAGYNIIPARFIERDLTNFKNGVEFNTVIKNIFRGAPLTSSELDILSTNEETECQYLMLSNIKDGIIDEKLPYLTSIDKKYEKYCIKNKSLLISKNGAPFKLAVAEIKDDRKVLANGNLYVIELDEDKADPYYLQAFFMSKAGQQLLNKFVVGATIPNLPVNSLKTAIIPLPDLKEQKIIAEEYASTVDEINLLNKKIEKAKERLSNCFVSEVKGG